MVYDFSRFSPQSFELLIQALAVAVAGAKVQIFGAGRDGAREATYEGRLMLGATAWEGYTVFQAKHRQFPETSSKDADWIINELEAELDKFTDPKRNLRKPDFYVLASNVRLSASAADSRGKGEGGADKVMRHLKAKAKQVGIKDVCLWHADTLSSLLDIYSDVRQSYAFWVLPGDILAALLREIEGPGDDEVLISYLRRSLKDAREIKTKDIGQAIGRTVMLEEVFIDLPIDRQTYAFGERETEVRGQSRAVTLDHAHYSDDISDDDELEGVSSGPAIVAELMRRAASKFEPQDYALERNRKRERRSAALHIKNRIVLLGGPGQGKSTVGQFVAQLCRARLLNTLQIAQAPETNQTVDAILTCARAEQIPLIGPPRYPFHIELPRYADALSGASREERGLSILAHLALDISRSRDNAVSAATLRRWIGKLPTLIILDGLDEVPPSGNRESVIKAIEDLLDTIHEVNGDCLIFCTSRQQGYQQELEPKYWAHWLLEPLSTNAALRLAKGVSKVLVGAESRRDEVLATLSEAAEDATTSLLMISPLQVMLMFQLVSTHNNIPKDRWTLFQRHYETLRDREITKGGAMGRTISRHRSQIDSIHRDAGYLLHLRAEKAGGAEAYLTDGEFEDLVSAQLIQDGYEEEAPELVPEIARLATNRLVFLRSQVGGQVAFDVRSLQEFMAAARLTASPEDRICERLEGLAGRAHWLHVFKIACSKIYGSNAHEALRTPIIALLDSLDAGDRCTDDRLLHTGARLALQLLADGSARGVPVFRRKLVVRALRLVNLHNSALLWELAQALDFRERGHLEPLFLEMLSNAEGSTKQQVLRLLAYALRYGSVETGAWTNTVLRQHLPDGHAEVLEVFNSLSLVPEDPAIVSRLRAAQWALPVDEVVLWTTDLLESIDDEESPRVPENLFVCSGYVETEKAPLLLSDKSASGVAVVYLSLKSSARLSAKPEADAHRSWVVADAATAFADDPGIEKARAFLETFAEHGTFDSAALLPWPLLGLLKYAERHGGIASALSALDSGMLGDGELWAQAEVQWRDEGVRLEGFVAMLRGDAMALNWLGATAPSPLSLRQERRAVSSVDELLTLVESFPFEPLLLNSFFSVVLRSDQPMGEKIISFLMSLDPSTGLERFPWRGYVSMLAAAYANDQSEPLFARLLAAVQCARGNLPDLSDLRERLIIEFQNDENQRHILMALAAIFLRKPDEVISGLPPSAFAFFENDCDELRSAVVMLRMAAGRQDALETEAIQALLTAPLPMLPNFLNHLTRSRSERHRQVALAVCRVALTSKVGGRFRFEERLAGLVEALPATFSDPDEAERLSLPSPLQDRPPVDAEV